jgi:hypothetical protein
VASPPESSGTFTDSTGCFFSVDHPQRLAMTALRAFGTTVFWPLSAPLSSFLPGVSMPPLRVYVRDIGSEDGWRASTARGSHDTHRPEQSFACRSPGRRMMELLVRAVSSTDSIGNAASPSSALRHLSQREL